MSVIAQTMKIKHVYAFTAILKAAIFLWSTIYTRIESTLKFIKQIVFNAS